MPNFKVTFERTETLEAKDLGHAVEAAAKIAAVRDESFRITQMEDKGETKKLDITVNR